MPLVEDTTPWYKQFWPWFIILLPASVVVAGITTLFIAIEHEDSLVDDDYYQQGLGINRLLAEDDMAAQLAVAATIKLDPVVGEIRVILAGEFNSAPSQLLLRWIHPIRQQQDFSLPLTLVGNNAYAGQLSHSIDGRWYIELSSPEPAPWRLKTEVLLQSEVQLQAAGSDELQLIVLGAGAGS